VNAAELVRTARRHAGLSQRAFAAAAGVDASTVAAVEAGRRAPGAAVLSAMVQAAGLELTVDRPVQPLCRHVERHLRLSLSARLHLLVGGTGRPHVPPVPPAFQQLGRLAARGRVYLTGRAAVGMWLPRSSSTPLRWGLAPRPDTVLHPAPDAPGRADRGAGPLRGISGCLGEVVLCPLPAECTVTVPLPIRSLLTPPPGSLALQPECAPWRTALRSVAHVLDQQAPLDGARRRSPAHREPDREDEAARLLWARRWTGSSPPPHRLDGRGWRLQDEVGFDEWIERRAVPR